MSKPDSKIKTQAEVLEENAKLSKELTDAKASADKATADLTAATANLAAVTAERDQHAADLATAKASLASVTKERDQHAEEVVKLKASQADFDKKVAAKVAELGISANAAPKNKPDGKPAAAVIPLSAFNAMSHVERNQFIRDGGKLSD